MSYRDDYRYPYEQSEVKDENPMTHSTKCPKCGGEIVSKGVIGTDRHNQEMEADWEECEKCGFNPEGFMTPQEQAEAMALTIRNSGSPSRVLIETLSKLIAENESAKKETEAAIRECVERGVERDAWMNRAEGMKLGNEILSKERDNLQSQLTATEAKLSEAVEILRGVDGEMFYPEHSLTAIPTDSAVRAKAFLSTLTAEKKEEAK